jgi:hypothetical protein
LKEGDCLGQNLLAAKERIYINFSLFFEFLEPALEMCYRRSLATNLIRMQVSGMFDFFNGLLVVEP